MITVRTAFEREVPRLAEIGLIAWEQAILGAESQAERDGLRRVAQLAFLSFAGSGWSRIRVAEQGGQLLGWAACERPDGTVTDLWIRPEAQRQGIGSLLMTQIEAEIAADGFETAEVSSHADNRAAIAFFQQRGYRIAWLSTRYAQRLDRDVEQIGLRKALQGATRP